MSANHLPLIIVTGLSGAGKSTAINVFEDLGFFSVDGLPAALAAKFVNLFDEQDSPRHRGLILGMDLRQDDFLTEWRDALAELRGMGVDPTLVFIEARTETLIRRYATTRRPHPLEGGGLGLEQAIETEREALLELRNQAGLVIDTTQFSVHDLRRLLQEKWTVLKEKSRGMRVHLITFGFKYGVPSEADMVYDLRFLPNPYFVEGLRPLSGRDKPVADYVLAEDPGKTFLERFTDFLLYMLPLYDVEGRYRLTIAIGCTGGRHRSVSTAEAVHLALKAAGYSVSLEHRHLELG